MKLAAVVTTYNSPVWLEKVLWGYENQLDNDFELIIADDGSDERTANLLAHYQARGKLRIRHVWQEDDGFQKTRILNKAIMATDCGYLIFTDGDCIPRNDYIQEHKRLAKPGFFVSGGLYRLNMTCSQAISEEQVQNQSAFDFDFLASLGQDRSHKRLKLNRNQRLASWLNRLTPTKATFNGGNSGVWRADLLKVNGFDERMQYGGEDRETGERLENIGIRGIQGRYSIITIHLDHKRGYENPETWAKNNAIRKIVKNNHLIWTEYGINPRNRDKK